MVKLKIALFSIIILSLSFIAYHTFSVDEQTVLFDEAHGQPFTTEGTGDLDLSELGKIFKKEGWLIKTTKSEITDEVLADVDALVISGAFKPLGPAEINAILRFVEQGGRLSVMLHIGSPLDQLLYKMQVTFSNNVIHEKENIIEDKDINYSVVNLKKHELFDDIDRFNIYGGWALMNLSDNAEVIAQTSAQAWVDLNGNAQFDGGDAQQALGVILVGNWGKGQFVVFGDDAMFQNHFLEGNNHKLATNLAGWLKHSSGTHSFKAVPTSIKIY